LPVLILAHCDGAGGGAAAALTAMLKVAVWVRGVGVLESATVTPKLVLPAEVGVPLITPALESDNPAGKLLPEVSDQE